MDINWTPPNLRKATVLYDLLSSRFYANYSADKLNDVARVASESIHGIGPFFSGYISEAAIHAKLNEDKTPCCEHFNSRQVSGIRLIEYFLAADNNPSFEEFLTILGPLCRVHKTTKEENIQLTKHQSLESKWQEDYNDVGIKLVHVGQKKLTKKYLKSFVAA